MLQFFKRQPQNHTDEVLVKQYQNTGDMRHLGQLYERYMELVYGVSLKYLKDKGKSEDAVMAIFEELTVKVKKHEISNFKSWLHVLTKNHCLMQLRKENKPSLTVIYDSEIMHSEELVHPVVEQKEEREFDESQIETLKACINKLKGQQKKCIELFYFEEKSYKQIAKETKIELKRVRSLIQNGRRNLKICVERNATSTQSSDNQPTTGSA